ncbi:MAG TPA: twin-arginine translocase subunit TatC [Luteolibacter sp.]|nr:twin-arginine translocase subunit TatC [Luteolibacter sp.]
MYLLKKIIQLREKVHVDHEKPFLEHLEDLRKMIMRVAITLVIAMAACFSFQKQLMEILRRPVEEVRRQQIASHLPVEKKDQAPRLLTVELWAKAKHVEQAVAGLEESQRQAYYAALSDPELVFHARSVALLRAAQSLPEEARKSFVENLTVEPEMRRQVEVLVKMGPDSQVEQRGDLRLMSALKPTETFMLSMKLSFFAGIIVSFPLVLMFILQFVLPGLHAHEKKTLWPAMAIGFGLFFGGVLFAYFQVLPRALTFFYEWGGSLGVSNDWRIGEYISFATQFTLLFGVAFELPVVVMVLVKLGLLSYETMSSTRSYAIVAIMVLAAVLTPTPDAFTLSLMAVPMIILYEICIWLAWFDRRKRRREEALEVANAAAAWSAGAAIEDHHDEHKEHDEHGDPYKHDGWHEQEEAHVDPDHYRWEEEYDQFHTTPEDEEKKAEDRKESPDGSTDDKDKSQAP